VISLASATLASLGLRPPFDFGLQRGYLGLSLLKLSSVYQRHISTSEMLSTLANMVLASSDDADVVVLALGHLLDAIKPFQQAAWSAMHCGSWPYSCLQMATHQQVELLVGATQFKVALERHRVITLHQRVQELVHTDGVPA
jgi:hypothetical protein